MYKKWRKDGKIILKNEKITSSVFSTSTNYWWNKFFQLPLQNLNLKWKWKWKWKWRPDVAAVAGGDQNKSNRGDALSRCRVPLQFQNRLSMSWCFPCNYRTNVSVVIMQKNLHFSFRRKIPLFYVHQMILEWNIKISFKWKKSKFCQTTESHSQRRRQGRGGEREGKGREGRGKGWAGVH